MKTKTAPTPRELWRSLRQGELGRVLVADVFARTGSWGVGTPVPNDQGRVRVAGNSSLELDARGSQYRVGVELALELVAASMIGIEFESSPTATDPTWTRFSRYRPILDDLMAGAEVTGDVGRRLAAFAFGIAELARIAAVAYEHPKAPGLSREEIAGVVVSAFRDIYLSNRN